MVVGAQTAETAPCLGFRTVGAVVAIGTTVTTAQARVRWVLDRSAATAATSCGTAPTRKEASATTITTTTTRRRWDGLQPHCFERLDGI